MDSRRMIVGAGLGAGISALLLGGLWVPRAAADAPATSQAFDPSSRFALLAAPVAVRTRDGAGPVTQDALFRIDTRSGQVWVYQGCIHNLNRPEVLAAEWVPVRDIGAEALRRQIREE